MPKEIPTWTTIINLLTFDVYFNYITDKRFRVIKLEHAEQQQRSSRDNILSCNSIYRVEYQQTYWTWSWIRVSLWTSSILFTKGISDSWSLNDILSYWGWITQIDCDTSKDERIDDETVCNEAIYLHYITWNRQKHRDVLIKKIEKSISKGN